MGRRPFVVSLPWLRYKVIKYFCADAAVRNDERFMQDTTPTTNDTLTELYDAFNRRDIAAFLKKLHPIVKWANDLQGGFLYGRDAVRDYSQKQFATMQPHLEPREFTTDDRNRHLVTVHQIVRDLDGNVLVEQTVTHRFTIKGGYVTLFEINPE